MYRNKVAFHQEFIKAHIFCAKGAFNIQFPCHAIVENLHRESFSPPRNSRANSAKANYAKRSTGQITSKKQVRRPSNLPFVRSYKIVSFDYVPGCSQD